MDCIQSKHNYYCLFGRSKKIPPLRLDQSWMKFNLVNLRYWYNTTFSCARHRTHYTKNKNIFVARRDCERVHSESSQLYKNVTDNIYYCCVGLVKRT